MAFESLEKRPETCDALERATVLFARLAQRLFGPKYPKFWSAPDESGWIAIMLPHCPEGFRARTHSEAVRALCRDLLARLKARITLREAQLLDDKATARDAERELAS